jgi:hypothetical protein
VNILTIAMLVFVCLESLNVLMLYFTPGTKRGNGIGVFNAWEKSKEHKEIHELVRYLVFWVAGTKLIFIALLLVIIITGERVTQLAAVGALILSILSFFWKLFPIIKRMDANGWIDPKGYSKTLGVMIGTFVAAFTAVFIIALV